MCKHSCVNARSIEGFTLCHILSLSLYSSIHLPCSCRRVLIYKILNKCCLCALHGKHSVFSLVSFIPFCHIIQINSIYETFRFIYFRGTLQAGNGFGHIAIDSRNRLKQVRNISYRPNTK